MREHRGLFHGKRIDNGEWVEGYYVCLKYAHYNKREHLITDRETGFSYVVDPDTVGECTSLKDKNGKLMFEGDIILIRFENDYEPPSAPDVWYEYAEIIWDSERLGWFARFFGGDETVLCEYDSGVDITVCGNIHDNHELLKGGEGA